MIFKDREDAGKKLAQELEKYKNSKDTVVLGLPRGGVVVAYEVAEALGVSLDRRGEGLIKNSLLVLLFIRL